MTDAPSRAEANRRTYDDARLAAIYDVDNPAGEDHAFFRRVADEVSAARASTRIVDLGCGTGILTVTLAGPGRDVVGIDPAEAMLAAARARPGGDGVEWRHGDAGLIAPDSADLVVMSGNVAMHLVDDDYLVRLGMERLFEGLEHIELESVSSTGDAAISEAVKLAPDLVLMETMVRDVDGVQAVHRITSQMPQVKVAMATVATSAMPRTAKAWKVSSTFTSSSFSPSAWPSSFSFSFSFSLDEPICSSQ